MYMWIVESISKYNCTCLLTLRSMQGQGKNSILTHQNKSFTNIIYNFARKIALASWLCVRTFPCSITIFFPFKIGFSKKMRIFALAYESRQTYWESAYRLFWLCELGHFTWWLKGHCQIRIKGISLFLVCIFVSTKYVQVGFGNSLICLTRGVQALQGR